MVGTGLLTIAAGILVVGLGITGLGLGSFWQWYRLSRQSAGDVHQVIEGPTEVQGAATPLDTYGTVRSGLTGEACLLYEYTVEEYSSGQHGGSWEAITSGSDGVPFLVGDETGRVLVDPDGARLALDREYSERLEPGDEPSETVASFLARSEVNRDTSSYDIGITELSFGDDQRFRERRIHPGETVYVAGVADRSVGDYDVGFGGPNAVIRAPADRSRLDRFLGYPFVLSDQSEAAAEWSVLKRSLTVLVIGGVTALGSGYLVAASLA